MEIVGVGAGIVGKIVSIYSERKGIQDEIRGRLPGGGLGTTVKCG
jgi:hypothetical protein